VAITLCEVPYWQTVRCSFGDGVGPESALIGGFYSFDRLLPLA